LDVEIIEVTYVAGTKTGVWNDVGNVTGTVTVGGEIG
jgi:hypothetical protein